MPANSKTCPNGKGQGTGIKKGGKGCSSANKSKNLQSQGKKNGCGSGKGCGGGLGGGGCS